LDSLISQFPQTFEKISNFKLKHISSGVVFDSMVQTDFQFLSELEMLTEAIFHQDKSKISDSKPDLYFVTITSLSKLSSEGVEQQKLKVSQELIHKGITIAINTLSKIYNGKFSAELLLLDKSPVVKTRETFDSLSRSNLARVLNQEIQSEQIFDRFFPSIYLKSNCDQFGACTRVRRFIETNRLLNGKYSVICNNLASYSEPNSIELQEVMEEEEHLKKRQNPTPSPTPSPTPQPTPASNTTTPVPTTQSPNTTTQSPITTTVAPTTAPIPDDSAMEIFQVVLWFSIFFVILLIAVIWAVYAMDIDYDSNIYRATNVKMH